MLRIAIDTYVLESLMPDLVGHDRRPSAFLVYLHLWQRTKGGARPTSVSYRLLADGTGLSKRATQDGLAVLAKRRLVSVTRSSPTASQVVTLKCPWRRAAAV